MSKFLECDANIHNKLIHISLFILDGKFSPPDLVDLKVARCKHGSVDVLKDAGHLFPMDSPAVTGKKKANKGI